MSEEYHVNHVGDVCSPECIPTPDWVSTPTRKLADLRAERDALAAALAAVVAVPEAETVAPNL